MIVSVWDVFCPACFAAPHEGCVEEYKMIGLELNIVYSDIHEARRKKAEAQSTVNQPDGGE